MTEADATRRPLQMPERFLSYLEKHRLYVLFKDMLRDLIINLPRDHLKHIKIFMSRNLHSSKDSDRIIMLVSPELHIDLKRLVKALIKDLGFFVITRRCVMDRYEKHDDYEPGYISPVLMSTVTKMMVTRDPVIGAGWLFFDHPCTVREARCLQQDGVLPTVTLVLIPPPPMAPPAYNDSTSARNFFQQDFEGLKFVYKATLKEVHVEPEVDDIEKIANKCFNAIRACATGGQGPGQGFHVVGAPGVYRVILIGPLGSGRKTQARLLARHFGLVYLNFSDLYNEAKEKMDDIGEKLRKYGSSVQLRAEVVERRVLLKDCVDNGWVLTGYPTAGLDFEYLDNMPVTPNRGNEKDNSNSLEKTATSRKIIFLNADWQTCKERALNVGVDWCTGKQVPLGSGKRVVPHPGFTEAEIEYEIEYYFTEALAELRAAAGITAVEISVKDGVDEVQVKIQAAVIAAPEFDIECCSPLRNVRGD